jgi:PIN domain nuclease of toxin-antitoxin system
VKALLDTNIFLWLDSRPERLGDVVDLLADPATELLVSPVVSWEIAIKFAIGRLDLRLPPGELVPEGISRIGARAIAIEHLDALRVASLPPIHGDPFDRLLVAQAIVHGATLITGDKRLAEYPADVLVV